jgi:hypothetical protein
VSAGGKTIWGDPSEVEKVVGGATFDVVLDNNGKDLDAVKYVNFLVFLLLIAFSYLFFSSYRCTQQVHIALLKMWQILQRWGVL